MKFDIKEFKEGSMSVNCSTKEKAEKFLFYLHEQGIKWCDGNSIKAINNWDMYDEGTCYSYSKCEGLLYGDILDEDNAISYDDLEFEPIKKVFNVEKFKNNNVAVRCRTEKEATEFLNYLDGLGFEWRSGDSLHSNSKWGSYKEKTCYTVDIDYNTMYSEVDFYKRKDYVILDYNVLILELDEVRKSRENNKRKFNLDEFKKGELVTLDILDTSCQVLKNILEDIVSKYAVHKKFYFVTINGCILCDEKCETELTEVASFKLIGNYFLTYEEAEKHKEEIKNKLQKALTM